MRVAIISNNTSDIIKSRGELIKAIMQKGHEVIAIGNEDVDIKKIEQLGVKFREIKIDRTSVNLFINIKYIIELSNILQEEKVDVILGYTLKPIIFGAIAGRKAKVKRIYALLTGMGYMYSINSLRTRLIRFFCNIGFKISGKMCTKFIFQNKEDRDEFVKRKFIEVEKSAIIDGSGVNMDIFKKTENKIEDMNKLKFLMISRGLNVKGIKELALAAEKVHEKYPNVKFTHIGKLDDTYRGISSKEIKKYSKHIKFEGKVNNVYEYIADSNVIVLPSYLREGIPRVLLEALAVGRPIITTSTRGCKETVIENENGYLVEAKNVEDLIEKILLMVESTPKKLCEMSEVSYNLGKERFDVKIINRNMLKIMELD